MLAAIALIAAVALGPQVAPEPPCANLGVRGTIRCAVARWPVPGGYRKALSVATCESGLRPRARYNGHLGVYQQRDLYWLGRWRLWGEPLGVPRDPLNHHGNIVVSIRQAHAVGWGPWSCA